MIDLEEIRSMAAKNPHMRVNTLLHLLEKRKKVEELREQRNRRDAIVKEIDALEDEKSRQSFFQWILNRGK